VRSRKVSISSPFTEQQRQPLASCTRFSVLPIIKSASTPTSPNSLTMTTASVSAGSLSRALSSVVLPDPRNPVISVTQMGIDPPSFGALAPLPPLRGSRDRSGRRVRASPSVNLAARQAAGDQMVAGEVGDDVAAILGHHHFFLDARGARTVGR